MRRKKILLIFLIFILHQEYGTVFSLTNQEEKPVESSRVPQSFLSVSYLPSFGVEKFLEYHSQFGIDGGFYNLLKEGPYLHLFYNAQHYIGSATVLSNKEGVASYLYYPQSYDSIGMSLNSTFLSYCGLNIGANYIQNLLLTNINEFKEYNYRIVKTTAALSFNSRRSDFDIWYEGYVPTYPHKGVYLSLGISENWVLERTNFTSLEAESQLLFSLGGWWTLSFYLKGTGGIGTIPRPYKFSTYSIGGPSMVGDYVGWTAIELRYYSPMGGFYFYTPPFWYLASYSIKLIPGFLVGINGNLAGNYDTTPSYAYGFYVAPLLGIYIMESLATILRFDIGLAQNKSGAITVAIYLGNVNNKPFPQMSWTVKE
ncbi:MAG: hypothetical protein ACP5Q5_00820 [Brevinematia bacterium]